VCDWATLGTARRTRVQREPVIQVLAAAIRVGALPDGAVVLDGELQTVKRDGRWSRGGSEWPITDLPGYRLPEPVIQPGLR
jgi:hypothetical protein